jgi:hypothetical protein
VSTYTIFMYASKSVHMAINPSSFLQPQNNTALILASDGGHVEVVKLLVALPGIDYNHEDNEVWCQNIPLLCMPQKVYTWPLILRHFCNHRITLHLSLQVIKVMLKW